MQPHHLISTTVVLLASLPAQDFVNFESPQVHPIEVSRDGTRLFACNTPDNRLAIYSLFRPQQPTLIAEVFTGLEPVSVRQRTADEVWVVNYLSDTISVVSIRQGVVVDTIRVKDEPTDVVFAAGKAFVSVSGSDEIRVFDAVTRKLLRKIAVFGDEPRSLAVGRFERSVWVVVHRSGNETTILEDDFAPAQPKPTNPDLPPAPKAGLIIHSEDRQWTKNHTVVLPDFDVVEIDTATMKIRRNYPAVGTINQNVARRPGTNELWIANSDARNLVRFVTNLRGHAWDNRVTRVRTGAVPSVVAFDLNPGIDYTTLPNTKALSTAIAQPTDVVWDPEGTVMYVAGHGTDRVAVVDPAGRVVGRIEIGTTPGTKTDPRRKRGPRGLAVHPSAGYLYVLNRISNSITLVDTGLRKQVWELALPDPTPVAIKEGRGFLYDAKLSGNGTFSCASCHNDADLDGLAWDLGDPGGDLFRVEGSSIVLHPMKGPLTTQTLRGLKGTNPFHWRGDKPELTDFNGAFDALLGKSKLSDADMGALVTFIESITYPPNPNLNLNRSLKDTPAGISAKDGAAFFHGAANTLRCVNCHTLPTGTNGAINPANLIKEPQAMKVSQLRNMYKRNTFEPQAQGRKGGFGLLHDGSIEGLFDFLSMPVFGPLATDTNKKLALAAFCASIDNGTAPTVGYQVTVNAANVTAVESDVLLLITRTRLGDIDLVAKGEVDGQLRGYVFDVPNLVFVPDSKLAASMTWGALKTEIAAGRAMLTFTGVPPGSGQRMGVDRDRDALPDADEGVMLYGRGTKGCEGVPVLFSSSEPRLGNVWYSFVGTNAPKSGFGLLGMSPRRANMQINGITLLVDVAATGRLIFQVKSDPRGVIAVPLPIPNNPTFVGFTTYNQLVWFDKCAPKGFSASNGMKATVTK